MEEKEILENVFSGMDTRRDELVNLVQELVRIPSLTGKEGAYQEFVKGVLGEVCDSVEVWEPDPGELEKHPAYFQKGVSFSGRPNVVGILKGKGGGKSLALNIHADVVEPGDAAMWRYGPWSGEVASGRLYGRGSVDTKANLAVITVIIRILRSLGVSLKGDLFVQSVVGEEWGGGGSLAAVLKGPRTDGAIIFEPTGLEIHRACRGVQTFKIQVFGKGAHPVYSFKGVSAIEKAFLIYQALKELEREKHLKFKNPLYSRYPVFAPFVVGKISGDTYACKVPEICTLEGLMGVFPGETYMQVRSDIEEQIAGVCSSDPWLKEHPPELTWCDLVKEATELEEGHPLVQLFCEGYREAVGSEAVVSALPSSTDMHYYINYGKIPSVLFGPGDCGVAHTAEESVEIDDLVKAGKILAAFLLKWCGMA